MQSAQVGGICRSIVYFGQGIGGIYKYSGKEVDLPVLYSDAATSCVISFCCGCNDGIWTIVYAHIDSRKGIINFFDQVQKTFTDNPSNLLHLYACGAVDYEVPSTKKNCGRDLYNEFNLQLNHFNASEKQIESKINLKFHTPNLLFEKPNEFKHHYGYDTLNNITIDEYIPLNKEDNIDIYGVQCATYALYPCPIYWMNNEFSITLDSSNISRYGFHFLYYGSLEDNELNACSTTPEIEPKEFYQNSKTAISWVRNNFKA